MPLTDTAIKNAKPGDKPIKLSDEKGLFLLIALKGGKWWRFKYRFGGKEKLLSLGTYPQTGLKEARARRDEARAMIASGTDPAELRKTEKVTLSEAAQEREKAAELERLIQSGEPLPGSFRAVAIEWASKRLADKTPKHRQKVTNQLERYAFPFIGDLQASEVTAAAVLDALRRLEERGILETMRKVKQHIGGVMRYAVITGRAAHDPTTALAGALTPVPEAKHHAAPTEPKDVARVLRIMAGYTGSPVTCCALRVAPLLFCRPGELRQMLWDDVDLDAGEWRYTATKKDREQIVPLAHQAVEALRELQPLTGGSKYVFKGANSATRPMSENTVNDALKRLGIDTQNELTRHGFRAMARTMLEEIHAFRPEVVELQINHKVSDPLGRAYNRTKHLDERKRMMQVWADYLDELREAKNVIHANFTQAA